LFGVDRSIVCEIVYETCQVIVDHLLPKSIFFHHHLKISSNTSEEKWEVPQCIGAIDDSHILAANMSYRLLNITGKGGTLYLLKLSLIIGTAFLMFMLGG